MEENKRFIDLILHISIYGLFIITILIIIMCILGIIYLAKLIF